MVQMTVRVPDDLVKRVKLAAQRGGLSVNEFTLRVLDAATDPNLAGSEADRIRERLAAAGLLATGRRQAAGRPAPELVMAARAAAGQGTALAEIVSAQRG